MPKDTISVSFVQNRLAFNNVNYYNPLLIYKSNVLASKHLALSVTNLQDRSSWKTWDAKGPRVWFFQEENSRRAAERFKKINERFFWARRA